MQKLLEEYLSELNDRKNKNRRARIIMALLVLFVVGGVVGILAQYGIAMTGKETCGMEEHTHSEECYTEALACGQEEGESHFHTMECYARSETPVCGIPEAEGHHHEDGCYETQSTLACGLEESEEHQHDESCYTQEQVLVCGLEETEGHQHSDSCYVDEQTLVCGKEEGSGHVHSEDCYEQQLTCGKEEHTHTDECYIDRDADREDASQWDESYADVEWKDSWGEDLVLAAQMQVGYQESHENYQAAEDGAHKGYTRYGDFAGDAYCDWDAAFVNFCIHYAGMDDNNIEASGMFPGELEAAKWYEEFLKAEEGNGELIAEPEGYEPAAGDLIFFEIEGEENALRMGIVSLYDEATKQIHVIEGNVENEVQENTYGILERDIQKNHIFAYLKMTEAEAAYRGSIGAAEEPAGNGEGQEPEEEIQELTTEVDGTTITLSGPVSSFEEGKEYTLQAEKVEDEEIIATIEEALTTLEEPAAKQEEASGLDNEPAAGEGEDPAQDEGVEGNEDPAVQDEENRGNEDPAARNGEAGDEDPSGQAPENQEPVKQVKNYQAFDIKLFADGQEVQPLGPVNVKFSSQEVAQSVEDEKTDITVLHVDENTGEATDMEAVATDEKDVVIETEHFSVYVYVEVTEDPIGGVTVDIQHWGENIETIDKTAGEWNDNIYEESFDMANRQVVKQTGSHLLYTTDVDFRLPNETYLDVTKLSKVCNVGEGAGEQARYKITKVWVSEGVKGGSADAYNETAAEWAAGTYREYTEQQLTDESVIHEISNLRDGSVIRFWYEPVEAEEEVKEPVTFYDYDISTGVQAGNVLHTEEKGINAKENFENNGKPKLGIGQDSSGNKSSWAKNQYGGKNLNEGNKNLQFNGLVQSNLADGKLAFNPNIDAPNNLFSHDPDGGSRQYDTYKLGFNQKGDTYILQNVYNGDTLTNARNLTHFETRGNWNNTRYIFSNEFWPLDDVKDAKDPLMGKTAYYWQKEDGTKNIFNTNDFDSDAGHNWYFGMEYNIEFEVGDYMGPLEYYFRGDDDFWLFLDGELVVDLGGIHAALGKTFDVREYFESKGNGDEWKTGKHTLTVYFMERGGSGSCCYMQFTLPKAKIVEVPQPNTTTYTVEKLWEDNENGFRPQDIEITLYKQKGNGEGVRVRTLHLPLRNEAGELIDQDGNPTTTPVWTYTLTGLPKEDGKTGEPIKYYVKEVYISVIENNTNPMLGYDVEMAPTLDGTSVTITNKMTEKKVKVTKDWKGDEEEKDQHRPDSVKIQLYANGEPYLDVNGNPKIIELKASENWTGDFENLPQYYYDNTSEDPTAWEWKQISYSVKEYVDEAERDRLHLRENEMPGKNGAIYEVSAIQEDPSVTLEVDPTKPGYVAAFKVENTLISKSVQIEKISPPSQGSPGNPEKNHLEGAEFELIETSTGDVIGVYVTGKDGFVDIRGLRIGEIYYLKETKAPEGYWLLEDPIILKATEEGVIASFQIDGWDNEENVIFDKANQKYTIKVPNITTEEEPPHDYNYELPSTGGSGIYLCMSSGVLLMVAAALIIYKTKCKEVLGN